MGRKPKDVPTNDHREMCRMHNEQAAGPRVIARHFNEKYHPSHITRLLAKCHQLINPAADRDAVAKTIASIPDTALVNVQPGGNLNAVQVIKSRSTLSAVEKSAFGSDQVDQTQSRRNLTAYTSPSPEPIDENNDSNDDNYENDSYPSSYNGASAPPPIVSLTSGLIDPVQAYTNVVNETINSGFLRTMGQYRDKLSKLLFPNLYPTQTNDSGDRLSETEKEVIRKAEDLLKRNEEEEKSHAPDGSKLVVEVDEPSHSCPCSPEPDDLDSEVTSNEATQDMNSGTESSKIQHEVTDYHQLLQTSEHKKTSPQESSVASILGEERSTSVTDDSKSKVEAVGVENSSTPPITVDRLSPPSVTETRQPAIADDVTRSESHIAGSQSAEVHVEQKTPVPQVNPLPNLEKQEILDAQKTEASNAHESSGQSADAIEINSINTPTKCQLNNSAPIVNQNEKPVTLSKSAYDKVNDLNAPATYPSEVENQFTPAKSGEIVAQTESTQNDSEWPWWVPLAIGFAGVAVVFGYDLYRKYRSRQPEFQGPR